MQQLKTNVPIDIINKHLLRKVKPFFLTGKDVKQSREIYEHSKKSLPDLLIMKKEFFKS